MNPATSFKRLIRGEMVSGAVGKVQLRRRSTKEGNFTVHYSRHLRSLLYIYSSFYVLKIFQQLVLGITPLRKMSSQSGLRILKRTINFAI